MGPMIGSMTGGLAAQDVYATSWRRRWLFGLFADDCCEEDADTSPNQDPYADSLSRIEAG